MSRQVRSMVVAAYLLLCILLGGSAQGLWTNLALQLLGIGLIAWAAMSPGPAEGPAERPLVVSALLGFAGLVLLLQLIPMPPSLWTELPGRSVAETGFALLGQPAPALPLSLTPFLSVMTLFAVIPALALFVCVNLMQPSPRWLAFAIVAGMTVSIALGAVQVASGRDSWAYLYPITNSGAVGVFANRNHMATLLLVSIPFAAALLASANTSRGGSAQGRWAVGIAALVLVAVGIALNGSLAAILLALPVLLASAAVAPAAVRWRAVAVPLAGLTLIGGVVFLATAPISTVVAATGAERSISSREAIWDTTARAIGDTFPAGTGLGSFERVYRQYEDPFEVASPYINHAHNDYLELVLELGAPGLALMILFLAWWAIAAVRVWTSPLSTPFGRAATIASAAILAHSVVDYPLRTAAISAVFAVAIALMARRSRGAESESAQGVRPARHVKLG